MLWLWKCAAGDCIVLYYCSVSLISTLSVVKLFMRILLFARSIELKKSTDFVYVSCIFRAHRVCIIIKETRIGEKISTYR